MTGTPSNDETPNNPPNDDETTEPAWKKRVRDWEERKANPPTLEESEANVEYRTMMDGSVERYDENNRRLCHATSRLKVPCKSPAMPGQKNCRMHGGKAPQTLRKARLKLSELVDPAIAVLAKEMVKAEDSADKQRAANSILDRAGMGRVTKVEAEDAKNLLFDRIMAMREENQYLADHGEDSDMEEDEE